MNHETAFEIMEENSTSRDELFKAVYQQAVENQRLAAAAKEEERLANIRRMRLEKEAEELERKVEQLKKTLGAL